MIRLPKQLAMDLIKRTLQAYSLPIQFSDGNSQIPNLLRDCSDPVLYEYNNYFPPKVV